MFLPELDCYRIVNDAEGRVVFNPAQQSICECEAECEPCCEGITLDEITTDPWGLVGHGS